MTATDSDQLNGPLFWAGEQSPYPHANTSTRLFSAPHDFREEACQHGTYQTVSLLNYDLAQFKQWPLILDEALRLFQYGGRGTLIVGFSKSNLMSQFAFAAFLRRRKDFVFELINQTTETNDMLHYTIACTRETQKPTLSSFEFAIITDGRKPDAVNGFIRSVMAITGIDDIDWSIAICGPRDIATNITQSSERIRLIEQSDQHTEKGWITHKKNLIVESSRAENLLIAHDRYEIPSDFLNQMRTFGPDFSVLAPAQRDNQGRRFPDWVATNSQWLCTVSGQLQYGDYSPHLYVNGGVLISKRQTLLDTPWNTLLFWDQNEDIELTRRMTDAGITPRLARQVTLTVTHSRSGFLYDFVSRLPYDPHRYIVAHGGIEPTDVESGAFDVGQILNLCDQNPIRLAKKGLVTVQSDWHYEPHGLVLLQETTEIALDLGACVQRQLILQLKGQGSLREITVNGVAQTIPAPNQSDGSWQVEFDMESILKPHSRFVVLALTAARGTTLSTLGLIHTAVKLQYPLKQLALQPVLGQGWAQLETWGVWSVGSEASLSLPIDKNKNAKRAAIIELTLIAFSASPKEKKWVGVTCDTIPIKLLKISCKKPKRVRVRIPNALLQDTRTIKLSLLPVAPCSPEECGLSLDQRKLGVGLIAIDVKSTGFYPRRHS